MRRVAKTVNFGLLYGMQAFGLSRDTGLSRAEAQQFIDQYWARLPSVKRFFDETINFGVKRGYVETLNKRRRAVPDLDIHQRHAENGRRTDRDEHAGAGHGRRHHENRDVAARGKAGPSPRCRRSCCCKSTTNLCWKSPDRTCPAVAQLVREAMEGAADLSVPLLVEVASGPNWEEMTDLA